MNKFKQIIALVTGVLGVLLIVRSVVEGIWPLSIQFVAGVLLVVLAALRWRTLI